MRRERREERERERERERVSESERLAVCTSSFIVRGNSLSPVQITCLCI